MKKSEYKSHDDLPLFLNEKWGPHGNAKRFSWGEEEQRNERALPLAAGRGIWRL